MINNQLFSVSAALISLVGAAVVAHVTSLSAAQRADQAAARRALVAGLVRARAVWCRSRINRRRRAAV